MFISGDLDKLGITNGNAINLVSSIESDAIDIPDASDITRGTTLNELGYDISKGLVVNGEQIAITPTTTIGEIIDTMDAMEGVNLGLGTYADGTRYLEFTMEGDITIQGDFESLGIETGHNAIDNGDGSFTFTDEVPVSTLERITAAELSTSTTLGSLGITMNSAGELRELTLNGSTIQLDPAMSIGDLMSKFQEAGVIREADVDVAEVTAPEVVVWECPTCLHLETTELHLNYLHLKLLPSFYQGNLPTV